MSLFRTLFGETDATGVASLLSPEQRSAIDRQSMMALGAKLLQASGRSPQRIGTSQAIGGALQAAMEAQQAGQMNAVQQMLLGQKIQEAKSEAEAKKRWLEITGGGAPATAADALAMPGRMGPTADRAAQIGTVQPHPLMAGLTPTQQAIARTFTNPAEGLKYISEVEARNAALDEVVGEPFQASDLQGRQVLLQRTKRGNITTVEGFGPKRDVVLHTFGGRTVAIDKNQLQGGETFQHTPTISERIAQANLEIAQENFVREGYTIQDTDQGKVYVSKDPTKPSIPVIGPSGAQLRPRTDAPADFTKSAKKLKDMEGVLKDFKEELQKNLTVFPPEVPLPFGARIPLPTGKDTATIKAKYNALLMGVKDLYELGALTGPDMGIIEQQLTNPASFAGILTSDKAMLEQVRVLEDMLARSRENLSTSYNRPIPGTRNITVDY
jgi:hypothetical protein